MRNNTQNNTKTIQKHRIHKRKKYKTKTIIKRILKNISRVIGNNKEKQIIMRQRATQNLKTIT